ncbi:PIN/TRAM domain-containing protein, partial [Patescibacteria group bacterium]|nr:PIN/TRAM domain-containing protein [Patescibacteria group bacterium]
KRPSLKETKIVARIIYAVIFFVLGFMIFRDIFFKELPFFGYHTVAEVLGGIGFAAFGFFIFPLILMYVKYWIEALVVAAVSKVVSDFWDLQSKRIQQARREKQRLKADEKSIREKQEMENAILLDTSILIDGRILDVVKAGFLDRPFVVTHNVMNELQKLADNKNKVKRSRGRMGLDVIKELKKKTNVIVPDIKTKDKDVDSTLVEYAKEKKIRLMTLDFNLNKVAKVSGISVLNINDLVNALKTVLLPGEKFKVKIVQEGKEKKQGIGYLTDGTMVIVEEGIEKVGEEVEAVVIKVIQSSAGKIIFSEVAKNGN